MEIYVDGALGSLASLGLPRPDVCEAFPGIDPDCPAVGFSGSLSDVALGKHALSLLIRDRQGEIAFADVAEAIHDLDIDPAKVTA